MYNNFYNLLANSFSHHPNPLLVLFNPILVARSRNISLVKKIIYVSLSILIGLPTCFIPHLLISLFHRKVTRIIFTTIHLINKHLIHAYSSNRTAAPLFKRLSGSLRFTPNIDLLDARTAFHFLAHAFGANSRLEGHKKRSILQYLCRFLDQYGPKTPSAMRKIYMKIQLKLNNALTLARALEEKTPQTFIVLFQKQLEEAKKQQSSLILYAGWIDRTAGHTMYFEIIPENFKKCTMRIYNLGEGIQHHKQLGGQVASFIEWKSIEFAHLNDPSIIQIIWELRTPFSISNGQRPNFNATDIYESLRLLLNPQEESIIQDHHAFKSSQAIGICEWKSLSAFLAHSLPKEEYKQLICDLKLSVVSSIMKADREPVGGDLPSIEGMCLFQKKAAKNMVDYISKQVNRGNIPPIYLIQAHEVLKQTQARIHLNNQIKLNQIDQSLNYLGLQEVQINHSWFKNFKNRSVNSIPYSVDLMKNVVEHQQSAFYLQQKIRRVLKDCNTFHKLISPLTFKQVEDILKAYGDDLWRVQGFALHQVLLKFFLALPYESRQFLWHTISAEDAQSIIGSISFIADLLFASGVSLSDTSFIPAERSFIFIKMRYLLKQLARVILHQKNWIFFGLDEWNDDSLFGKYMYDSDYTVRIQHDQMTREMSLEGVEDRFILEEDPEGLRKNLNSFRVGEEEAQDFATILQNYPYWEDLLKIHENEELPVIVVQALAHSDCPIEIKAQMKICYYLACNFVSNSTYQNSIDSKQKVYEPHLDVQASKIDDICYVTLSHNFIKISQERKQHSKRPFFRHLSHHTSNLYAALDCIARQSMDRIYSENRYLIFSNQTELTDEEFQSYARLFSSKHLTLNNLLAYMREHPRVIEKPDFCEIFFHLLLYRSPQSIDASKNPSDFFQIHHLEMWFNELLHQHLAQGEKRTSLFILRGLRYLKNILPLHKEFSISRIEILSDLFTSESYSNQSNDLIKGEIAVEIVAGMSQEIDLSEEKALLMVKALVVVEQSALSSEKGEIDPLLRIEIEKSKLLHGEKLLEVVRNQPRRIINEIMQAVTGDYQDQLWEESSELPSVFTASNGDQFYPPTGKIIRCTSDFRVRIPSYILNSEHFSSRFPGVIYARQLRVEDSEEENVYEFIECSTNRLTRFHEKNDKIQQWIDPYGWCQQADLKRQNFPLLTRLNDSFYHWATFDKETSLLTLISEDRLSRQIYYESTIHIPSQSPKIKDLKKGWMLSTPSFLFRKIEDPSFIEEWYDEQKILKQIHLPRFGLTFTPDYLNKLSCDQIPDYFIDLKEPVHTPIRRFSHLLILKNKEGVRKVLLPRLNFRSPVKKESLEPSFELDCIEQEFPLSFYLLDIDQKGQLSAHSQEAELHLAYIYALSQHYKKAANLLKHMRGHLFSFERYPLLKESLEKIIDIDKITGDKDPHIVAIASFCGYLLLQNQYLHGHENQRAQLIKQTSDRYQHFLNKLSHIRLSLFTSEEELQLLSILLDQKENITPLASQRAQFLKGEIIAAQFCSIQLGKDPEPFKQLKDFKPNLRVLQSMAISLEDLNPRTDTTQKRDLIDNPEKFMLTRAKIEKNFLVCFLVIQEGSPQQKNKLRAALIFATHSAKNNLNLDYEAFLIAALEKPHLCENLKIFIA